jgi:hypothetical protein
VVEKTIRIRIFTSGSFEKLVAKIQKQFLLKHGFEPCSADICESIAKAVEEKKLFG